MESQSSQWDETSLFVAPTPPDMQLQSAMQSTSKSVNTRGGKGKKSATTTNQQNAVKLSTEYTLKSVVELLILLGLTSATLWEQVLFKIRKDVSDLMNTEVTNLFFALKMVAQAVCAGVVQSGDLSQEKLEALNDIEKDHSVLMSYIEPTLSLMPNICYSTESVKNIRNFINTALKDFKTNDSESNEPINKKPKLDTDTTEAMLSLFGKSVDSKKRKNKEVVISQQFSLRDEDTIKKYSTPGEKGKFLVKIEVTDCDDLRGVGANQYWTKVWKKAVFLLNSEENQAFKILDKLLLEQLKKISEIKDVQMFEFDDQGSNQRKSKFGR